MSLEQRIDEQLAELAAKDGAHQAARITVREGQGVLECDITAVDSMSCKVKELSYKTPDLDGAPLDRLEKIGGDLTQRVRYLPEPLALVELDGAGNVVQVRSSPPQRDDTGATYFELLARPGEINLRRYHKSKNDPRDAQSAVVTRETLKRLARDIADSV